MKNYVVGLAHDDNYMAFVRKNRPEWQAGLLNGIGGKVEEGETFYEAMVREFSEETGTEVTQWRGIVDMIYPGQCIITFYAAEVDAATLRGLYTATDERIEVHSIEHVHQYPNNFIHNLRWIVPLATHSERYRRVVVEGNIDHADVDSAHIDSLLKQ